MTINVDPSILKAGSAEARKVAQDVGTAREAAAAALPGNAFGILCSPLFLPMYTVVQTAADQLISSGQSAIERAASGLDSTADRMQETDDTVGGGFNAMMV